MSKDKKTKGTPDKVDIHVGNRLRIRRSLLGLSQEKLADAVGITFQQIQKYERGMNRISAGRLYQFSKLLEVPVTYFYEKVQSNNSNLGFADNDQESFDHGDKPANMIDSKETQDLLKAYYSIENEDTRKAVLNNIKIMAKSLKAENKTDD